MIRRFLMVAAVLILLAPVGGWFWLGSDGGRQWLAGSVASLSDGTVELRGLTGHPLSQISADLVLFNRVDLEAAAASVTLEWSPWRMLFGELAVVALSVDRVTLRFPESPAAEQSAPLSLPARIVRLEALRIGELIAAESDGTESRIGDIRLDGLLLSESLAGRLQAHHAEGDLALQLAGSPERWMVEGDIQSEKNGAFRYSLSGRYLQQGGARLEGGSDFGSGTLQARWQRDEDELKAAGEMQLQAEDGEFSGSWQLDSPADFSRLQLHGQGVLSDETRLNRQMPLEISVGLEAGEWAGSVEESGHGLRLEWQLMGGRLEGELSLDQWDAPLTGAPGQLSGSLSGSWRLADQQWQLQGDIDRGELAGVVAGLKLNGEGDAGSWRLDRAEIRAPGLDMKLSGSGDMERLLLSGTLAAQDVGPALGLAGLQGAAGRLQADLQLAGSYTAPEVTASGRISKFRLASLAADAATLSLRHAAGDGSYRLAASGLSLDGRQEMERLDVHGRLQGDMLTLGLASEGRLQLAAEVAAGIIDGGERLEGAISDLQLRYEEFTLLQAERLPFRVEGESIHLAESGIRLLGAEAVCSLDLTAGSVRGRLDMPDLRLAGDESLFGDSPYHMTGDIGVSISLDGHPASPTAVAVLTAPALQLGHAMFEGKSGRRLELSDVRLGLDYRRGALAWQLQAAAPAESSLNSSGQMALQFSLQPWQLEFPEREEGSGTLSARLGRLSDLQPLLPRLDPLEGGGSLDLNWSMPVALGSVEGRAGIDFAALGVPEFGLEMAGAFRAGLEMGRPHIDLRLQSVHAGNGDGSGGELIVRGPVDPEGRTMPEIRFNRFPLMQLPDQQLTVSGTITASQRHDIAVIRGDLEVVQMRFEIPEPAPGPTEDLQWKGDAEQQTGEAKVPLSGIDIDLALGDDAEIYGRGMSLKPQGRLHLGGSLTRPGLTGVLELIGGRIEFRSVRLDILAGSRVVFSGDPKRPAIYIRAGRKAGEVLAGVIVEGPVDRLNSRLFSEPQMSNAEIFSYIATGRPLASLGRDSAGDMVTAAEFLLGPGTMLQEVQGGVQQATGLDIFEIGGDASGGRVRAGQRLSEDVTLSLEQTVSKEATTALTLEYMLSESISVFARQAVNMAPRLGLRYSKEWFGPPAPKE